MKQVLWICTLVVVLNGCGQNVPTKAAQPGPATIAQSGPPKAVLPLPVAVVPSNGASPIVKPVAKFAPDATHNFDSPEGVTRVLEQRWSVEDIKTFCIPERRHNPAWQNLVADTPVVWRGKLYQKEQTGFDEISWYGTVKNGKLVEYSLGVRRGNDFWSLEGGSPESVMEPPVVAPDPAKPHFVGHKWSLKTQ
jgi:hypothetical protein